MKLYLKKLLSLQLPESSDHQIIVFGIVMFINFPLFYLIWHNVLPDAYANPLLRALASLLCIPLIFIKYWPKKIEALQGFYWRIAVVFCLPFFFTFMTLGNQLSAVWLMSSVSALFFTLLLFKIVEALLLILTGLLFGSLCHWLSAAPNMSHVSSLEISGILFTFIAALIIGSLFAVNNQLLEEEKIQASQKILTTVAHELLSPLSSISAFAGTLRDLMPKLVAGYRYAKKSDPKTFRLNSRQVNMLLDAPESLSRTTSSGQNFIRMFLQNVKLEKIPHSQLVATSAVSAVTEAVKAYPLYPGEEKLIDIEPKTDFDIKVEPLHFQHVIFNLLKNALFSVKDADKGNITIWFEKTANENIIHFKDTGLGMSAQTLAHIFDAFYTETRHGTGGGLGFCKATMRQFNGEIDCQAKKAQYAHFRLKFPQQ